MLRPISMPEKTGGRFTDYSKSMDSMILTIAVSSQNLKNGESYDELIHCGALKWRSCYRQTGDIRDFCDEMVIAVFRKSKDLRK